MNSKLLLGRCSILIYLRLFCVSLSPSRKFSRILLRLGYEYFLYNPFQFIIHHLSHNSMLIILDPEDVKHFTENRMKCNKCGTKSLPSNLMYYQSICLRKTMKILGHIQADGLSAN
jgi:hypothetical protein